MVADVDDRIASSVSVEVESNASCIYLECVVRAWYWGQRIQRCLRICFVQVDQNSEKYKGEHCRRPKKSERDGNASHWMTSFDWDGYCMWMSPRTVVEFRS